MRDFVFQPMWQGPPPHSTGIHIITGGGTLFNLGGLNLLKSSHSHTIHSQLACLLQGVSVWPAEFKLLAFQFTITDFKYLTILSQAWSKPLVIPCMHQPQAGLYQPTLGGLASSNGCLGGLQPPQPPWFHHLCLCVCWCVCEGCGWMGVSMSSYEFQEECQMCWAKPISLCIYHPEGPIVLTDQLMVRDR